METKAVARLVYTGTEQTGPDHYERIVYVVDMVSGETIESAACRLRRKISRWSPESVRLTTANVVLVFEDDELGK